MKVKNRLLLYCLSIFFIITFASCSQESVGNENPPDSKLKVLCTIHMISDLVNEVGGEHVSISTLIKKDLDPHTYELVKGDNEKFLSADLVFYNGLGLEHQPNIWRHLKSHAESHAIGSYIKKNYPDLILYVDQQVDPHLWLDISIWAKSVDLIVETLSRYDPVNKEIYSERGKKLFQNMMKTHEDVLAILQSVPENKRYLVTSHDAFNYFTKRYLASPYELKDESWRNRFIAPEGLAPDSQLSTTDIANVIHHLIKHNIRVVFPESNVNIDSIYKIQEASKQLGHSIRLSSHPLYGDSMGRPGESGDTYLKMILHNAKILSKHLQES